MTRKPQVSICGRRQVQTHIATLMRTPLRVPPAFRVRNLAEPGFASTSWRIVAWQGFKWCRLRDSNPRPTVYKTVALPAELSRPHDISQMTEICGPALSRQAKPVRCHLAGPPFLTTGLQRRRQSRNSGGMPSAPSSHHPIGGLRYLWIACTTTEPSPTPEATRLTEPERTSPTANTPESDVPNGEPP